jgi:RNA polymerase sigma-70 factor (ECF subfamily)
VREPFFARLFAHVAFRVVPLGLDLELFAVARVAERDRAAFHDLYLLYHRRLARFLMRFVRRYDLAGEVINDTMWEVWRTAADFKSTSRVSVWIMGIAYRRAVTTLRLLNSVTSHMARGDRRAADRRPPRAGGLEG